MNKFYLLIIVLAITTSCNNQKTHKSTHTAAGQLHIRLTQIADKGIMFGHQDDLAYGVGWNGIKGQSDVKRISGDYPAIFGWEIGEIGYGNTSHNIDNVPFDSISTYIQRVHAMGGINTISWHALFPGNNVSAWNTDSIDVESILKGGKNHKLFIQRLDIVANFFDNLRDEHNKPIPIIFRPWHEMDGGWFWWGSKTTTNQQYIQLFRFTIEYLRNTKKLTNILVAYSPDRNFKNANEYLSHYPGDEYVDILGMDNYGDFSENRLDKVVKKLSIVVDLANEKNKIAAFTETGSNALSINNWYTSNLLQVLKANNKTRSIAYVMVWRNHDKNHFYVPYPNHKQANDFKDFSNDELMLLLNDINQ